jgi:predicted flap endonuclease-1-like 5' DNA nuclease
MPSQRSERTVGESPRLESYDPSIVSHSSTTRINEPEDRTQAMSLHVSKLRGISLDIRNRLKRQGISYTHQLLREAGGAEQRSALAERGRIDEMALARLVRRADLARVKGIGAIFADMLEMIEVNEVTTLAQQQPAELHRRLYDLNSAERLARRAPTPDEVQDWIAQAQALPRLVDAD